MQHLKLEELARLVDEPMTEAERAHIDRCEICAGRLTDLREQTRLLSELEGPLPPADEWSRLEASLAEEGLARPPSWRRRFDPAVLRAAAAAAIFIAGSLTGGGLVSAFGPGQVVDGAPVRDASVTPAEAVRLAEAEYIEAIRSYSRLSEPAGAPDPVNRLAALEGILLTTQSALRESPDDPIINNYHLTALGLRDELVRQLETTATEDEWF